MAALAFMACQKDQDLQQSQKGNLKSTEPTQRYEDYEPQQEVESEITSFLGNVENQTVSNMPLNEAVWKIEAALGYTNRYQLFNYTESEYKTLQYEISMNGDFAQGTSVQAAYTSMSEDLLNPGEHFVLADLHAEYTGSDIATLVARVKVSYDKNPWDDRDISVGERRAAQAEDCSDNPRNLTGHDLVAKKALAKYRNSISYDPTAYYFFSSIQEDNPSGDLLPGGDNALFQAHAKYSVDPTTCVTLPQMEAYRDHVATQFSNINGIVLDCRIMFNDELDGTQNGSGQWSYIEEYATPINVYAAGVIVGKQNFVQEPFTTE